MKNKLELERKKTLLLILAIVTIIATNFVLLVKYQELASEHKELEMKYYSTRYELIAREYAPMMQTEFGIQVYGGYQFLLFNGEITIDEFEERLRQANEVIGNETGTGN
ncbi:hypothetical protein [Carnobacterium maltaromaticum]|uniref:hypothetical protein n=1 Tax=Carnobacterium maltaromaticum TaxID=2751 RepID=UPI0012FC87A8|nr:hypothetical protein [Carnobacterium maltaromaticum]